MKIVVPWSQFGLYNQIEGWSFIGTLIILYQYISYCWSQRSTINMSNIPVPCNLKLATNQSHGGGKLPRGEVDDWCHIFPTCFPHRNSPLELLRFYIIFKHKGCSVSFQQVSCVVFFYSNVHERSFQSFIHTPIVDRYLRPYRLVESNLKNSPSICAPRKLHSHPHLYQLYIGGANHSGGGILPMICGLEMTWGPLTATDGSSSTFSEVYLGLLGAGLGFLYTCWDGTWSTGDNH